MARVGAPVARHSRNPVRGTLKITVEVPVEDGEVIAKAIERVADAGDAAIGLEFAAARRAAGVRDSGEPAANGWCAQQADALLAIAKASLAGRVASVEAHASERPGSPDASDASGAGSASHSMADHHQVVIHVDESALRGGIGRSDLPIDTVKRLCCDCSVVAIVEDERGTPLDVGRKQRLVSTPLKRALWSRDRGCTFPGCRNTHYVEAHHVRHWADGGDTSLENLMLICWHHHRLLHEGGFAIRRDSDGEPYFVRPDGRVIPRCGYRLDDMVDDVAGGSENPSAEGWQPPGEPSAEGWRSPPAREPSAKVREQAAVYRIGAEAAGQVRPTARSP